MSLLAAMVGKLSSALEQVAIHPYLTWFMRVGYAAKGVLYLFIGLLAGRAALLSDAEVGGTYEVLLILAEQFLGKLLLLLLAIGLLGYVLRRFLQAVLNPKHQHLTLQQLGQRGGYIMSGCGYLGVSYSALMLILGQGKSDDTLEDLASQLFEQPFGNWLVIAVGVGVTGVGLSYIYGAFSGAYLCELKSSGLHRRFATWVIYFGKIGVATRGMAFILMGVSFIEAAIRLSAEPAGGLKNAFQRLAAQSYGPLWLGLIGLGFIAYALYMAVAARYRQSALA